MNDNNSGWRPPGIGRGLGRSASLAPPMPNGRGSRPISLSSLMSASGTRSPFIRPVNATHPSNISSSSAGSLPSDDPRPSQAQVPSIQPRSIASRETHTSSTSNDEAPDPQEIQKLKKKENKYGIDAQFMEDLASMSLDDSLLRLNVSKTLTERKIEEQLKNSAKWDDEQESLRPKRYAQVFRVSSSYLLLIQLFISLESPLGRIMLRR